MNPENPNFSRSNDSPENTESFRSDKKRKWEQVRVDVDTIGDKLGLGIDEKIKDTVTAFKIHEFTTSQSCEGHVYEEETEDKHGLPFPWVEVYAPAPEGWENDEDKKEAWRTVNLKQQQKMMALLAEFYQQREVPLDAHLSFSRMGIFGGFRVQSFGAELTSILSSEEQKQKLELYRKEMDDFTLFLKDKFFSENK